MASKDIPEMKYPLHVPFRHGASGSLCVLACLTLLAPITRGGDLAPAPRVHIAKGLWHRQYRLEEALGHLGGAVISEGWHRSGASWNFSWTRKLSGGLGGTPADIGGLIGHDWVILCNIDGHAIGAKRAQALKAYAEAGGTVLFLGGKYAFGSQYAHVPALQDLSPVTFVDEGWDQELVPEGLPLAPGPAAPPALAKLAWKVRPCTFWIHNVVPKQDSEIWMAAGDRPALIVRTCGKGRVALFAGTVMGVAPEGTLPLWEWDDWPRAIAAVLDALRQPCAVARWESMRAEAYRMIEAIGALQQAQKDPLPQIRRLLALPPDAAIANAFLETVDVENLAYSMDLSDCFSDALVPALDASSLIAVENLLLADAPEVLELCVRLLARVDREAGIKAAARGWRTGKLAPATRGGGQAGMLESMLMSTGEEQKDARALSSEAAGIAGGEEALALVRDIQAASRGGRYADDAYTEVITLANKNYQRGMFAALRCGDRSGAADLIAAAMENQYVVIRGRSWTTSVEDYVPPLQKYRADGLRWQRRVLRNLEFLPESAFPALAAAAATFDDPRIAPIVFRIFSGHRLDAETCKALAGSPVPAVSALATPW